MISFSAVATCLLALCSAGLAHAVALPDDASGGDSQSLFVHYWPWLSTVFDLALVAAVVLLWRMRDNSRLLELALDQANDGVYLIDGNARFIYVNDAACRSLGYSRKELLGMRLMDIDPSITIYELDGMRKRLQQAGEAVVIEAEHCRRDGSLFPVEIKASLIVYRGRLLGMSLARDISARKRAEAALQASEREFRSLAENMPDNIARWDVAGRLLYSNPTHQKTLSKKSSEIIGKTHAELFPDGRYSALDEIMARVVAEGEGELLERVPVHRDNGEVRFHDLRLAPEFDEASQVVSVLGIGRDMTDIYRLQEAIAARERDFRSLAENMPDNVVRWDAEGRYLYINPIHERTLNRKRGEVVGTLIPDSHDRVKAGIKLVAASGKAFHAMRQRVVIDGVERLHDVSLMPEFDEAGQVVSVLGIGRDMTDSYRMQDALAAREQEYRSLAESSPDFIVRYDREGLQRYINSALAIRLGLRSAADMQGKRPSEMWPDGRFDVLERAVEQVVASGLVQTLEMSVQGDGREETHHILVAPELSVEGGIIGAIAFGRDITERKQAERELAESREQLRGLIVQRENAREEERKFIAREIHDEIGQILTGLKMGVSVLEQDLADSPASGQVKEIVALTEMAIAAGRNISAAIRPAELDMGIVAALQWQVNRFGMFSGIPCELHIDDEEIQLDEAQAVAVCRIVQEGLTNAARHARANKVDIRVASEGEDYILEIADDGCGFDKSARKAGSFGLVGMRERVLMLGGELSIDSRPGRGTEIFLRFPAQPGVEGEP